MERLLYLFLLMSFHRSMTAQTTPDEGFHCLNKENVPVGLVAQLLFNEDDLKPVRDLNCSAFILNPHWLLAPASCLFDYNNPSKYQVKLPHSNSPNSVASQIIRNPSFNNELGAGYDLALINVGNKLNIDSNCMVGLTTSVNGFHDDLCKFLSWNAEPQQAYIHNKPMTKDCTKYVNQVSDSGLVECATPSVCRNKSGSVIVCPSRDKPTGNFILRSISSWGDLFCDTTNGYLFTRVTAYVPWILRYIGQ